MKERILKLLINGLKASEIASIVGCSPAYVSQLLKDSEFVEAVQAGKLLEASEKTEEEHIDIRYQTIEHKVLSAIEESIGEATFGEKLRAIEVINKRMDSRFVRKNPGLLSQGQNIQVNVVSLAMPQHAIKNMGPVVEMNSQKEIVAIEGKALAPMSSDGVKGLFQQIAEQKALATQVLGEI